MFHRKKAVNQVVESTEQSYEFEQLFRLKKLQKVPKILLRKGDKNNTEKT